MTSTDAAPQLLPGISASVWRNVLQAMSWVSAAAIVALLAATVFHLGYGSIFAWLYPALTAIALTYLAIFIAGTRSKAEAAAGYTTLWQRLVPALPAWIGITVLILVSGAFGRLAQGVGQVVGLSLSLSLLAIAVIANVIAAFVARGRIKRMREAAPGDLVFLFASSKQFRAEAAAMDWQGGVDGTFKPRGVSADRVGLTFWQGKPPGLTATLPWSRVLSVQEDRLQNGNNWQPALLISYKDDADDIQALPLANANADLALLRSMPEVRWLASELNGPRTGNTTARVT